MASGLYNFIAGAKPLATEWNDYISKQTVMVYASAAARDSDLSVAKREGMLAYLSDTNRYTYYDGANWLIIAGRTGVVATGSTQSIANNSLQTVNFDAATNVNGTFITPTSTTFTIPSGLSGRYAITAKANLTSATSGTLELQIAGDAYDFGFNSSGAPGATVGGLEITATSTVVLAIKQTLGSAQNCNFKLSLWYTGPST